MTSHSENPGRYDFATLTPLNPEAISNFARISDKLRTQPLSLHHHSLYIRLGFPPDDNEGLVTGPEPNYNSDTATTEVTSSSDFGTTAEGCYLLSIIEDHPPFQPKYGWAIGSGSWKNHPDTGKVDLLLAEEPAIYPRHLAIRFDSYGRSVLDARHKGVELNGETLPKGSSRILHYTDIIRVGPLQYRFQFVLPRALESEFQEAKRDFLQNSMISPQGLHDLTSATPSANDVKIGDWVLHGIAGKTPMSTINAASNIRTHEAVAVKTLIRSDKLTAQTTSSEVRLYEALKSIQQHRHGRFVMCMHSVLYKHTDEWPGYPEEFYLLWSPLADGTFQEFSATGKWSEAPFGEKLRFFTEACLGLQAVHQSGWVHRDIKPQNLLVVRHSPPRAIVADFGSATQIGGAGLIAKPATCGTIGWVAPELENPIFAPRYTQAVDVWSMGAVGCFLFYNTRMPWEYRKDQPNIFLSMQVLLVDLAFYSCQNAIRRLGSSGNPDSIQRLLYGMIQLNPSRRLILPAVLSHPALEATLQRIESDRIQQQSTGEKRPAS
ncbi:MAG: hypothetical protein Q9219_002635 [cf. Caloplaca sp. 3 TL-2023]